MYLNTCVNNELESTHVHIPISTHREYTATIQTSVVYSESRHVECGPAECDIAGRSVLLWVSERKRAAGIRSLTLLVTTQVF